MFVAIFWDKATDFRRLNLSFDIHVGIEGAVSTISSASIAWDSSSVST
jgi:hypothetical protein